MKKRHAVLLALPLLVVGLTQSADAATTAKVVAPALSTAADATVAIGTTTVVTWTATVHVDNADDGGDAGSPISVFWMLDRLSGGCTIDPAVQTDGVFAGNGNWTISVPLDPHGNLNSVDCAGDAALTIGIAGEDDSQTWVDAVIHKTLDLQRATRIISTNAAPEPVTKGHSVTTVARLQRATWGSAANSYVAYHGKSVALQFQPTGGSFTTLTHATSSTTGHLSASATQSKNGCWRYDFGGNSVSKPITSLTPDCVTVK